MPAIPRTWLFVVLAVTAVTHLFFLFAPATEPSPDEAEYLALGASLSETGELVLPAGDRARRSPLFPALVALADRWQGRELLQGAVLQIQAILSAAVVVLLMLCARRIAGPRAGIVAGLLAATYSPFRYLQSRFLCETTVIALWSAALLAYLAFLDAMHGGNPRRARMCLAATSAALGLSVLARPDAAVLVIPFALDACLRTGRPLQRLGRAAAVCAGVVCCAGLWAARNHAAVGAYTLSTTGGLNFYLGHNSDYAANPGMSGSDYGAFDRLRNEGLTELEADRRLFEMGRAFISAHPGEAAMNCLRKARVWLSSSVTWSAPTALLIVAWALVAGAPPRYRMPLMILAVILSAVWLGAAWQTFRPWANPRFVVPLGLIGLFLMVDAPRVRPLLIGLFVSQMLVAMAFIPLERLRWTVDGVLLIAIGAAVARLSYGPTQEPRPLGRATLREPAGR